MVMPLLALGSSLNALRPCPPSPQPHLRLAHSLPLLLRNGVKPTPSGHPWVPDGRGSAMPGWAPNMAVGGHPCLGLGRQSTPDSEPSCAAPLLPSGRSLHTAQGLLTLALSPSCAGQMTWARRTQSFWSVPQVSSLVLSMSSAPGPRCSRLLGLGRSPGCLAPVEGPMRQHGRPRTGQEMAMAREGQTAFGSPGPVPSQGGVFRVRPSGFS